MNHSTMASSTASARRWVLLATCLWVAGSGCATGGVRGEPGAARPNQNVTAYIENRNWSDVTVYLLASGSPRRLATVRSLQTSVVSIPRSYLAGDLHLRFEARPLASTETVVTPLIGVAPGDEIVWTVESQLSLSSNTLRVR